MSNWQEKFKREFGIHFKPDELQFCIEFIKEVEMAERKNSKEKLQHLENYYKKYAKIQYETGVLDERARKDE